MEKKSFTFYDKLIVRCPSEPFSKQYEFIKQWPHVSAADLDKIGIASVDLIEEYARSKDFSKDSRLFYSFLKYQSRSSTRVTPFGLFAGPGIASWGKENNIQIGRFTTKSRIDGNVLHELYSRINKDLFKEVRYFFNNTIYFVGDEIRYVSYKQEDENRVYSINRISPDKHLKKIIAVHKEGLVWIDFLGYYKKNGYNDNEILAYFTELIDGQVLISEISPTGISDHSDLEAALKYLDALTETKNNASQLTKYKLLLKRISRLIAEIDEQLISPAAAHKEISKLIYEHTNEQVHYKNTVQTDLFTEFEPNFISEDIQKSILEAFKVLYKLSCFQKNNSVNDFSILFAARYEYEEIELPILFDQDTGLEINNEFSSLFNPLIDELELNKNDFERMAKKQNAINWNTRTTYLLDKIFQAVNDGVTVVKLDEKDIATSHENNGELAESYYVLFRILDNKRSILIENIKGPNNTSIIGRFASQNKEFYDIYQDLRKQNHEKLREENIVAEINHVPDKRVINVLKRPLTASESQIEYYTNSSAGQASGTIKVSDILVFIQNGKLLLKSKKDQKIIIPRLSVAHNYGFNSTPVYKFLCDYQSYYYITEFFYSWGEFEKNIFFLPRVEYKHIVLFPATWNLSKSKIEQLLFDAGNTSKLIAFEKFRNKYKIPSRFCIADEDNELFIDSALEEFVNLFFNEVKNRDVIVIKEFLVDTEAPLLKDKSGAFYLNQCVVFVSNNQFRNVFSHERGRSQSKNHSSLPVENEWLYIKLYCGTNNFNPVLLQLDKLLKDWLKKGVITKFFYIRYKDEHTHLRLRLKFGHTVNPLELLNGIYKKLNPFLVNGFVQNIKTDTYCREIGRYTSLLMDTVEDLFCQDSMLQINLIAAGRKVEQDEWLIQLYNLKRYYELFRNAGIDLFSFVHNTVNAFANEFALGKNHLRELDLFYRRNRERIERYLNEEETEQQIRTLFAKRDKTMAAAMQHIKKALQGGQISGFELNEAVFGIIHMSMNRGFVSHQRYNEYVMYYFFEKYLISKKNKEKQ